MGDQTQTQTTQIGAMSPRARQALETLANFSLEMEDPNLQMTDQDQAMIDEIRRRQMDLSRTQIEGNRVFAQQGVEESALARGVDQSTMGAVLAAMLGHQEANALNQAVAQGQATGAQQAMQLPFQRGAFEQQNNRDRLAALVQTLTPIVNYDMMERQGNATTTMKQSGGLVPQLLELGARGAAAFTSGGMSEVANAGYNLADGYGSMNPQDAYWARQAAGTGMTGDIDY